MDIEPKSLSTWLKSNGVINRKKFASLLGVSIKTTYQWTSGTNPIPAQHQARIKNLMMGDGISTTQSTSVTESNRIILEINEKRMRMYEKAAALEGMPLRQWLMNLADEAAIQDKKNEPLEKSISTIDILADDNPTSSTECLPTAIEYTYDVMGNIAAGELAAGDTIPYPVKIGRKLKKGEYILKVNGKSMEPKIEDGSLIIVKRYTVPPIPKLGTIIEYNDERGVTLKKLGRRKTEEGKMEYVLKSINPAYPDIDPMDGGKISAVYVETIASYHKM